MYKVYIQIEMVHEKLGRSHYQIVLGSLCNKYLVKSSRLLLSTMSCICCTQRVICITCKPILFIDCLCNIIAALYVVIPSVNIIFGCT